MPSRTVRILILCKTYPSPSGRHIETSCVAGMEDDGRLIRLFPVPFRLVGDEQQFKKWQWITARVEKAPNDHRPESHKIFVDTIHCEGDPISTKHNWRARRKELDRIPIFDDFAALDEARIHEGRTLGLLRPSSIQALDVTPSDNPDWTQEEKNKLVQSEKQSGLFEDADAKRLATLKKVPFDFHYRYRCGVAGDLREHRHKIVDWEAGALYWNCRRLHGNAWDESFRDRLERKLPEADLMFLMGTIHRFPRQWLIVSLIYPPKPQSAPDDQGSLFGL